ncbi:hypothetical protein [Algiphilus aromaticivorans]|uniref:hypothetical protein n=1 Tax=Algiphilus aromaticivorans TaxID=382454 RepID=UPI0005C1D760|nr:hypothetical protein [Algiphilus aromaticivorans]
MSYFATELNVATNFTGLSERQLHLLIVGMSNLELPDPTVMAELPGYLANCMAAEIESAFADHEEFGFHLGFPKGDNAEIPYEFHDLAEKLQELSHDKAVFLIGFLEGFMEARCARAEC